MNNNEFPKSIPIPEKGPETPNDRSLFQQDIAYRERAQRLYDNDYIEPETKVSPEECEQKVKKFLGLITAFEQKHSIEKLLAITELTAKNAPDHPVREPARKDLPAIGFALRFLQENTNILPEKYIELHTLFVRLQRAVGSINGGKVDHS